MTTPARRVHRRGDSVEDFLWISLASVNLVFSYMHSLLGPSAWLCVFQCVLYKLIQQSPTPPSIRGNIMALSLVPSLAHAVAISLGSIQDSPKSLRWVLFAKWTTVATSNLVLIANPSTNPPAMNSLVAKKPARQSIWTMGVCMLVLYDFKHALDSSLPIFFPWESILFLVLFGVLSKQHPYFVKGMGRKIQQTGKSHQPGSLQMCSWGEYYVFVLLVVCAVFEWQSNLMIGLSKTANHSVVDDPSHFLALVAQSGVIGCLLTLVTLGVLPIRFTIQLKVFLLVSVPLASVEVCLRHVGYKPISLAPVPQVPHCLLWLFEFFSSTESADSSWSRYWGVAYWATMLALLAGPTLALVQKRRHSVVITRKWFHLVAILLFAPTTYCFPQLMALGYAVALCGLLVLESLRHDAPALNNFYMMVSDPVKDSSDGIILSHVGLILGCAMPHWLALAIGYKGTDSELLKQWGVLCLGVGDAMGAVVGKIMGRTRWGQNGRTVEGSLAMWTSMVVVGWPLAQRMFPLLVAATFTTLLEAFTLQMDNLVLPLAGSIWIVLLSPLLEGSS